MLSEDPATVTKFVEGLREELARVCEKCVDFAFANIACRCGNTLLTTTLSMEVGRGLHVGIPRSISVVIALRGGVEKVVELAELVRDVAKRCGIAVRIRLR